MRQVWLRELLRNKCKDSGETETKLRAGTSDSYITLEVIWENKKSYGVQFPPHSTTSPICNLLIPPAPRNSLLHKAHQIQLNL